MLVIINQPFYIKIMHGKKLLILPIFSKVNKNTILGIS